ncbi:MAG: hypothetical protein K8U03_15290 [Planctomycetia bacterium]|nr:hypothetical protein [Planctomycetia bacterium]
MIAPIREPKSQRSRMSAESRKARQWIVKSLLSRPDAEPRRHPTAAWQHWLGAIWISTVAVVYLVKMLSGYFVSN